MSPASVRRLARSFEIPLCVSRENTVRYRQGAKMKTEFKAGDSKADRSTLHNAAVRARAARRMEKMAEITEIAVLRWFRNDSSNIAHVRRRRTAEGLSSLEKSCLQLPLRFANSFPRVRCSRSSRSSRTECETTKHYPWKFRLKSQRIFSLGSRIIRAVQL